VEARLDAPPFDDRLREALRAHRARGRLITCRPWGRSPQRLLRWVEVETTDDGLDRLLSDLADRCGPRNTLVARVSAHRALVRTIGPMPPVCEAAFASGGLCTNCRLHGGRPSEGPTPVTVLLPRSRQPSRAPLAMPGRRRERVQLTGAAPYRGRRGLTPRQDEALRVAHRLGFFDYPRKANLAHVARVLGVGRSTTLELLRHATRNLIDRRYGDDLVEAELS